MDIPRGQSPERSITVAASAQVPDLEAAESSSGSSESEGDVGTAMRSAVTTDDASESSALSDVQTDNGATSDTSPRFIDGLPLVVSARSASNEPITSERIARILQPHGISVFVPSLPPPPVAMHNQVGVPETTQVSTRQRRIAAIRRHGVPLRPAAGARSAREAVSSSGESAPRSPRQSVSFSHVEVVSNSGSLENLRILPSQSALDLLTGAGAPNRGRDDAPMNENAEANGAFMQQDIETGHGEITISSRFETELAGMNSHVELGDRVRFVDELPLVRTHRAEILRRGSSESEILRRPIIHAFLDGHPNENISHFIDGLSSYAFQQLSDDATAVLAERIERMIEFFNANPSSQMGLQDVAGISLQNCQDGFLGGLIEIEKFMADAQLVMAVEAGDLDFENLMLAAKKSFALKCIEEFALALSEILGSTQEAIEVELLLIKELSDQIALPVDSLILQNPDYALRQFHDGMARKYGTAVIGESLEARMNFIGREVRLKTADQANLLAFMSNWAPATAFVDRMLPKVAAVNVTDLSKTHAYLELVIDLAQKEALSEDDRTEFNQVLAFFAQHQAVIPESLYTEITAQPKPVMRVSEGLTHLCASAIKSVRDNLGPQAYLQALKQLYDRYQMMTKK